MASNRLEDLNNMLFNQLVRLDKDDISDEELKKEVDRSKAMNSVAHTIVDNARVVLDATKFMDGRIDSNSKLPHMIGVDAPSLMGLGENATKKIYIFQSLNLGGYSFAVLANTQTQAWELIKDRIASNKNQYLDYEFVDNIRNYSISSIDLNDADPQVINDWKY